MKKILLSIFMLITMTSYSQIGEKLQGIWKGESSSYYVMIVVNKEKNVNETIKEKHTNENAI